MCERQEFIKEVNQINSDINLHEDMVESYIYQKLDNEYVVGAYNNLYLYDFAGIAKREDVILIFTNKRAYYLTNDNDSYLEDSYLEDSYLEDCYVEYEFIDYVKSNIENENTDLNGLIFISFGKEEYDTGVRGLGNVVYMRFFAYYDNAQAILNDLERIMDTIENNPDENISRLTNEDNSVLNEIEVDEEYFENIPKDENSKVIYKEMLDDKIISEEQYSLLIS